VSLANFRDRFPGVCARLLGARLHNRVGHAYLLAGDSPTLLEEFATAWARVCACLQPTADGDACGRCEPCQLFDRKCYPERYDLRPQSKSRQILVDEVRAFEHQLSLATSRDRLKVGVLAEADCMNEQAQNAFLKTLEEPTRYTLLLLYSAAPRTLLPTIRSRCQNVSLLENRKSYDVVINVGLFPVLARLRRNAGAAIALATASRLSVILAGLQQQAEATVGDEHDQRWNTVAADDKALKKKLEEGRTAKVQAEYTRLRGDVGDALQTWFLQEQLAAGGVEPAALPHPELLAAAEDQGACLRDLTWEEANENVAWANELVRCLDGHVNERLALEAFCLSVCQIRNRPA